MCFSILLFLSLSFPNSFSIGHPDQPNAVVLFCLFEILLLSSFLNMPYASQGILQQLTSTDLSSQEHSSFTVHYPLTVAGQPVWAARISFVGEFGWELHVPTQSLLHVYRALMEAGQSSGLRNAGYRAIDSLSLEKGYRHWHGDLRSDDTPQEAGLAFTCQLSKEFLGRDVVMRQKKEGITKRLACFTLNE